VRCGMETRFAGAWQCSGVIVCFWHKKSPPFLKGGFEVSTLTRIAINRFTDALMFVRGCQGVNGGADGRSKQFPKIVQDLTCQYPNSYGV